MSLQLRDAVDFFLLLFGMSAGEAGNASTSCCSLVREVRSATSKKLCRKSLQKIMEILDSRNFGYGSPASEQAVITS